MDSAVKKVNGGAAKHTPGKLVAINGDISILKTEDGQQRICTLNGFNGDDALRIANCNRLAACWNACEGINPEAMPEMLRECKVALEYLLSQGQANVHLAASAGYRNFKHRLEAVIAKAEGRN